MSIDLDGASSARAKLYPSNNLGGSEVTTTALDDSSRGTPPIFRLPTELFLMIYFEYSWQSFQAPWLLGGVCRLFRQILLNSPSVWARLELSPALPGPKELDPEMLRLWLSRCGDTAEKVSISLPPWTSTPAVEAVCSNTTPIRFLALFEHSKFLFKEFLNLEELRLGLADNCHELHGHESLLDRWKIRETNNLPCEGEPDQSCLLNPSRFPKLRCLHLHSPSLNTMDAISQSKGFPALQELCMHATGRRWMDFVRPCASSLVKLSLRFEIATYISIIKSPEEISLPQLTHLSCIFSLETNWKHWQIPTFTTPALEFYLQEEFVNSDLIHRDVSKVKKLVIKGACNIDWDLFPSLTTLELHQETLEVERTCRGLAANPALCPNFGSLVVHRPQYDTGGNNPWPDFFKSRALTTQKRIICEISVQKHRIDPCYTYNLRHGNTQLNSNYYGELFYIDDEYEDDGDGWSDDDYGYDDDDDDLLAQDDYEDFSHGATYYLDDDDHVNYEEYYSL